MQKIILFFLAAFARSIIRIHKPKIVWVTGTVGKTTVTAHIYWYLSHIYGEGIVSHSKHHYNWEYWLPLTIIWAQTGWKNPLKWIWVFLVAISRFFRPYPQYLILEYGIDHPGEMDFLLSIAIPDIAILTEIAPNHLEQFWTFDLYKKEKLKMTYSAKYLIMHDSLRDSVDREAIYYGVWAMSDIDISHIDIAHNWTSAIVHFQKHDYPIHVNYFWVFHITNILPLYAIADIWWLPLDGIAPHIGQTTPESGRSTILSGIAQSRIVDGSYNGWYLALHRGISSMQPLISTYNIIFLIGDMRELGWETEMMHQKLADEIVWVFPHRSPHIRFYLVGPYMKQYVLPRIESVFTVEWSLSSRRAWEDIKNILLKNHERPTIVFVKWSQNTIFLEEAVEMLLDDPDDISKLCRQSKEWKRKKDIFFQSIH